MVSTVQYRYQIVREKIASAARRSGRDPNQVRLVVVTKGQPVEKVLSVVEAGARLLGENYAEEAVEKIRAVAGRASLEWHMIGHIQSRKASLVCEYFSFIHSLDSIKLATRLDRFAGEFKRQIPVLLECNVSGEESKFGFPVWYEDRWDDFIQEVKPILALPNLEVRGLMTMAPYSSEPRVARPFFSRLRRLRDTLQQRCPQVDWRELSMGMSADFEVAVQEGASMIRVGEAILGPRTVRGD
jgi:hypothetical protein